MLSRFEFDRNLAAFDGATEVGRYDYDRNLQRIKRAASSLQVEYVLDDKFVLLEGDGATLGHPSTRRYHYAAQPLAETEISGATRTTGFITNALWTLFDHPDQLDRWRHDRALDASAVEELMRVAGPAGVMIRRARERFPWHGVTVRAAPMPVPLPSLQLVRRIR